MASVVADNEQVRPASPSAVRETELSKRWREIQWPLVFSKKLTANRMFVRSAIIRKDLLINYARKHQLETFVVRSIDELEAIVSGERGRTVEPGAKRVG